MALAGSGTRRRSAQAGLPLLVPLIWLTISAPTRGAIVLDPFTLRPGSVGGDNYTVQSYGGPGRGAPVFNSINNGFLASPGHGYRSLTGTLGNFQTDSGGANAPAGNLAGGIHTSASPATHPNPLFGVANVSQSVGKDGISWDSFRVTDNAADTDFSVVDSRGRASYAVNTALPEGQASVALGVRGFLPVGTEGFASLVATFTLTTAGGVVVQRAEDAVIVYANNIPGSGLPNGVENYSVDRADGVAEGVADKSITGFNPVVDGSGNLDFVAFGVAFLPGVSYRPGDILTIDATLTVAVDPMATLQFELIPTSLTGLPPFGTGAVSPDVSVPEPGSIVMSGLGIAIGLGYAFRLRGRAAP